MSWISIILLFLFLYLHECTGWSGSKLGTTEYNQELLVIRQAMEDYKYAQMNLSIRPRKGVLCTTFLRASMETSVKVLFKNVAITDNFCTWAVVIYRGTNVEVDKVCHKGIKDRLVHCQLTEHSVERTKNFNQKAVPKTILYRDLLPYLPDYERIFLLDEDISLYGVNMERYMQIWDCSFSQQKPLITQPVIAESTQFFEFVNADHWKGKDYIASGVGLIEQQVPFFDAIFFEWFVRRVLIYTMEKALALGADCGHDRSWCNAAKMYGQFVLGWPEDTSTYRSTPCALIPGVAVHHLNLRSMENKRTNRDKFRELGHKGVQRYIDYFPTWCLTEIKRGPDPLGSKSYRYTKIKASTLPNTTKALPKCASLIPKSNQGKKRKSLNNINNNSDGNSDGNSTTLVRKSKSRKREKSQRIKKTAETEDAAFSPS